jgi:uncharacterized membrane protein
LPPEINNTGQIVGRYDDATGGHGFLDNGGIFSPIDVPFAGAVGTNAAGINNSGQIVGDYLDGTGIHGFLDNGEIFSTIDVPFAGVINTAAAGINDTGQIVGGYLDAAFVSHGFLATPVGVPEPSSIFLLGSTLVVLTAWAYGKNRRPRVASFAAARRKSY